MSGREQTREPIRRRQAAAGALLVAATLAASLVAAGGLWSGGYWRSPAAFVDAASGTFGLPGAQLLLVTALLALAIGAAVGGIRRERRRADARCAQLERQLSETSRATADVRLAAARLELGQQMACAGTFDWDLTTGRVGWSGAMERACGLQPGAFDGTFGNWRRLVHPEDLPRVVKALGDAIGGRSELRVQYRVLRPDGTDRWLSMRGRLLRDAAGRPAQLIGVNLDLTDELQATQTLRHGEEFFRFAANAHGCVVFDLDVASGRVRRSHGLAQVLGWQPDELPVGAAGWMQRIHPDDVAPLGERLREANDRGSERVEVCCRVRHRDGGWRPLLVRLLLLRDAKGALARAVGSAEDVTALRETDTMLQREAERRRSQPSGAPGRVSLRPLVAGAAARAGDLLHERGLRLALTLPDHDVEFDGDPERLSEALCCLLRHGAGSTPAGREIAMEATVRGKWAVVSLRDGCDRTAAQLTALFDDGPEAAPGEPIRESIGAGKGTVGLGQARRLVESHGGTLRAGVEGPGLGSRFTVTLPLAPEVARVVPAPRVGTR
jgi:PAS domain S-box-containing protein